MDEKTGKRKHWYVFKWFEVTHTHTQSERDTHTQTHTHRERERDPQKLLTNVVMTL